MHASIPGYSNAMNGIIQLGRKKIRCVSGIVNRIRGDYISKTLALALKLAFKYVMRNNLFSANDKSIEFFKENFTITDPNDSEKITYYQGKILFRTRKENDDVNVLLTFCPKPSSIYQSNGKLDIDSIIYTRDLTEKEAEVIAQNPDNVDLIIYFKDAASILGLADQEEIDMGAMLFENLVQFSGNLGQLFKFGGLARNLQTAVMP